MIVDGRPVYGNRALFDRAGITDAEPITVGGVRRAIVMGLPDTLLPDDHDLRVEATKSWRSGLKELHDVWADPGGAVRRARGRREAGVVPFEFVPDMPAPDQATTRELTTDELDQLTMPEFDGIGHERDWFTRQQRLCPPHAKILADLAAEFSP